MLELLKVGHCYHPEFITIKGGSWKPVAFPAIVGLLKHPNKGYILFDTGYSHHFITATKPFPERFYRWLTPMSLPNNESLVHQLNLRGIAADDINFIFISHFHADHIAGLRDFSNARFICSKTAPQKILQNSRWKNIVQGNLSYLFPEDFFQRTHFIEDKKPIQLPKSMEPFQSAYDLFGDTAMFAIPLPGHALGHYGLLYNQQKTPYFLIGDACWSINTLKEQRNPHPITRVIFSDAQKYYATMDALGKLHSQNTVLELVPSHCIETYRHFCDR